MTQHITRQATTYAIPFRLDTEVPKRDQIRLDVALSVELAEFRVVRLPAGFVTDFHSVPPILWSIWPPYNTKTNLAAMVHDYLYMHWEQYVQDYPLLDGLSWKDARHYADDAFLELMDQFSPDTPVRNYMYYVAVRLFGAPNWARFRVGAATPKGKLRPV